MMSTTHVSLYGKASVIHTFMLAFRHEMSYALGATAALLGAGFLEQTELLRGLQELHQIVISELNKFATTHPKACRTSIFEKCHIFPAQQQTKCFTSLPVFLEYHTVPVVLTSTELNATD